MKRMMTIATLLFCFAWSAAPSLGGDSGSQAPATAQQKEQYEKTMQERLEKLGKRLDELKARAATGTETARKEMNQLLAEAEKKRERAFHKLEEMRKTSEEKWRKFSFEMNEASHDFERAYERAKSRFKE